MVREDIFEGLKSGLAKGKNLQESMQSFYNSGYNKKEIEEAAKLLLSNKSPNNTLVQTPQSVQQPTTQPTTQLTSQPTPQPTTQLTSQPTPQPTYQPQTVESLEAAKNQEFKISKTPKTNQLVSYYDTSPPKPKGGTSIGLIIFLVIVLFILFGALIAVFLFRENIMNFFK